MKTRSGFVSNSSSSSFVIIRKEEDHNKAIKKLHPYYQKWIKEKLRFADKQKFAGHDILISVLHVSSEDEQPISWEGGKKKYPPEAQEVWYDAECEGDGKTKYYVPDAEVIDKYVAELKKISSDVIFETEDY